MITIARLLNLYKFLVPSKVMSLQRLLDFRQTSPQIDGSGHKVKKYADSTASNVYFSQLPANIDWNLS